MVLDSPAWYAWLEQHTSFTFVDPAGGLTVRKERGRPSGWYWKGYRRQAGKVRTAYLGRSADLSLARLQAAAQALAGARPRRAGEAPAAPDERPPWTALPRTKFFMPPPRPQRVQRPRLLARLRSRSPARGDPGRRARRLRQDHPGRRLDHRGPPDAQPG